MNPNWINDQFELPHGGAGLPPGLNFQSVVQDPVMSGSNPSGYEPMPWDIWKMIYGREGRETGGLPEHWATQGNPYGYSQVQDPNTGNSYFGMNPGNTQGGSTITNTNWVSTPWGNVPMANLNNPQASMFSMFGGNRQNQGPGTGVPTQKVGGAIVGGLTNLFIPGLGFLTGPLARLLIKQLQQSGGQPGQPKPPPMPRGSVPLPVRGAPSPTSREPLTGSDWFKNLFSGLPPGTKENRPWEEKGGSMSAYGGAPTFTGPSSTPGPQWTGGSIFGGTVNPKLMGTSIGFGGNLGGGGPVNLSALGGFSHKVPWYINTPNNPINYGGHSTDAASGQLLTPQQHAALVAAMAGGPKYGLPGLGPNPGISRIGHRQIT